jgi:TRAP-type mannitol/chloroaromatic compound transport system substrate-binding protein
LFLWTSALRVIKKKIKEEKEENVKTKVLSGIIGRVVILSLIIGLLVSCGGGTPSTGAPTSTGAGEVIKWRWQSMGTPGMKQYWVYEDLVARIKEASGGRLEIQLLPSGAVVGTLESFDAVSKGVVEVGSS